MKFTTRVQDQQRDIDILIKLLPYYEVQMNLKRKEPNSEKSLQLRRLLQIDVTDAEMLKKLRQITTLHELMNHYFDRLLVPDSSKAVIEDLAPCFFNQRDRVRTFLSTLQRLVWEYNFVNQTFVQ